MLRMTNHSDPYILVDVCLLLRAHAEQGWLSHELVPVLRQLEQRDPLPEEQLDAALAYLEVLWNEASQRAAETEAAHADLAAVDTSENRDLSREARSYHAAVCSLRDWAANHVAQLLGVPSDALTHDHAPAPCDRVRSREWRRASTSSPTPPTQTGPFRQRR
jgi:hypothetical protein